MKKLVVYYSLEGDVKFIAEAIAEAIDADILEIKPVKEINQKSFMKYFWGGRQIIMRTTPKLFDFNKNPEDYDVIFIGTPVWVGSYAPPLHTFFSRVNLKNKKIALFCCHGGGPKDTLDKMKKRLEGNEFIGELDFLEPLGRDKNGNLQKAKEWAVTIVKQAGEK